MENFIKFPSEKIIKLGENSFCYNSVMLENNKKWTFLCLFVYGDK